MTYRPDPPFEAIPDAWASLPAEVQTELGCKLVEMVFSSCVSGDAYDDIDRYCTRAIRDQAEDRSCDALSHLYRRVEELLPDLFGTEGEDPAWAWRDVRELNEIIRQGGEQRARAIDRLSALAGMSAGRDGQGVAR